MTLTELRYAIAVADTLHFGRAAERCFVSQPSLSAAVRNLEEELGLKLFERGSAGVLVTPEGEIVLAQARRVMEEAERVKLLAATSRHPLEGILKLGVIHTVAPYLLPDLVTALQALAPKLLLDIEENMTANLDQMLRAGLIDLAILALPYSAPGLDVLPLYDEEFRVIVPLRHRWAKRRSVAPDELDGENLLLLNIGHCFRDQVLEACPEFSRRPAPGKQGNSLETLRNMVASGLGISVLPATALTPKFAQPRLKALDFTAPRPLRRIVAAYRQGYSRRAVLKALTEAIGGLELPLTPVTG
ncbi:MAG: LysR family transcriptional regulator [Gammaproteobacteria bacterium]|nr:LysR family transcriptional regulator [Gammaproteobacteria bacterium]